MAERMKFSVSVRVGLDGDGEFCATAHAEHDECSLEDGRVSADTPYRDYVIEIECDAPVLEVPVVQVSLPSSADDGTLVATVTTESA